MEDSEKIKRIKAMLSDDPTDSFLQFALAKAYSNLMQYEASISTFEKLRANDPNYVGLYYHLAKDYEAVKMFDKARSTYEEGIVHCSPTHDAQTRAELQNALVNLEIDTDT